MLKERPKFTTPALRLMQTWVEEGDHKIIKLYSKMKDRKIQDIVRLAIKKYIEDVISKI